MIVTGVVIHVRKMKLYRGFFVIGVSYVTHRQYETVEIINDTA